MKTVEEILEEALPYLPRIYIQNSFVASTDETTRDFSIIYKYNRLPSDCLIFFVPIQNSVDGTNTLTFKIPRSIDDDNNITYDNIKFNIAIETNDGSTRRVTKGDIVAYRMCIFRFAKGNSNTIILTNSPAYNNLQVSNIIATTAKFLAVPTVGANSIENIKLATQADLSPILNKINELEEKIIWGVDDPEEVLASKENGTIYIQVEEE